VKEPSRTSPPSSPEKCPPVNGDDTPRDTDPSGLDHGQLLRQLLGIERQIRSDPADPARAPKPDRADQVLGALGRLYTRGDRISTDQIATVAGVGLDVAVSVRRWARAAGIWPYRPPEPRGYSPDEERKWEGGDT
jgi:hypothetical protein